MVQTGLLPLSGLFAWVFLRFYSTGSTESFFKAKVVKSYQCPLKDSLLRLHIFFLKFNLTRPNQKVFLSSRPEPSSQLPSPTCTKPLSCQASGFQSLPLYPSHYPSQPKLYIGALARRVNQGCKTAHVLSFYPAMLGSGGSRERSREKMVLRTVQNHFWKFPKFSPFYQMWSYPQDSNGIQVAKRHYILW